MSGPKAEVVMKHIHFVYLLVITIFSVTETIPQPRQKAVGESERQVSVEGTEGSPETGCVRTTALVTYSTIPTLSVGTTV